MLPLSICPVVLCGGIGSRLWPLSRENHPKQFCAITSDQTLFEETLQRIKPYLAEAPIIITNERYRFLVTEQAAKIYDEPLDILLEPCKRDTAPSILLAALMAAKREGVDAILVMPSDHVIEPMEELVKAIHAGYESLTDKGVCVFGITPTFPSEYYGYIQADKTDAPVVDVLKFVEKPDIETAQSFLSDGSYFWNSGIFLMDVAKTLALFEEYAADIFTHTCAAFDKQVYDIGFIRLDKDEYAKNDTISIDYALLEKIPNVIMANSDFAWSDAGNWQEIRNLRITDEAGKNSCVGLSQLVNCKDTLCYSSKNLVVAIGLDDVTVINADDVCLVVANDHLHEIKDVVKDLKEKKYAQVEGGTTDYRPWGSFTSLDLGDRHQVKMIKVKPGEQLSLQRHHHRAEHWIVVEGTAFVEVDGVESIISENQTIYIPLGAEHRLTNPGKILLSMIEVQTGSYLGEDDIVRISDKYNRKKQR